MKFNASYLLILILLLSSIAFAKGEYDSIITADTAVLNVKISSNMEIVPTDTSYVISYLEAKTSFYPKDTERQILESLSVIPSDYVLDDDLMQFRWNDPYASTYSYSIESNIGIIGDPVMVKKKISFPRQDNEYPEFVKSTEHIDSDSQDIQEIARTLVEEKDDYYDVVLTLAEWVHENINYNLSSLTADVSQSASWVLKNREGVCDEMTSLFIAFLRANNIPAKYVSGISYTNSDLFDYDFGPHGWAEVYFPDYGWIPFDVTYGEYGYVDASHVALKKSADSAESSTFYGWRGRNVDVKASKLDLKAEVISIGRALPQILEITALPIKKEIGFGSYNLIEATITNKQNYYFPAAVSLSRVENLEILSLNPRFLPFTPGETKKVYWLVKASESLNPRFTYTFPFSVSTPRKESFDSNFKVMNEYTIYSRQEMDQLRVLKEEEAQKTYSQLVMFYCEASQDIFYEDETPVINCHLKNQGEVSLKNVNVCSFSICKKIDVSSNSEESFSLEIPLAATGEQDVYVTAQNSDISKADNLKFYIMQYPKVSIKDIEYPEQIDYGKDFQVKFVISGENNPLDLKVNLHVNRMSKTWRLDQLTIDREFIINANSRDLYPKDNNISVKVVYDDAKDKSYVSEQSYSMSLSNLNFFQKIILYTKMYLEKILEKGTGSVADA